MPAKKHIRICPICKKERRVSTFDDRPCVDCAQKIRHGKISVKESMPKNLRCPACKNSKHPCGNCYHRWVTGETREYSGLSEYLKYR